jgi:YHS domain-containing protein
MADPVLPADGELQTVCGGKMDEPEKFPHSSFHGKKVFFCTHACLQAFESDPEGFMAGEIAHPDEDDPNA